MESDPGCEGYPIALQKSDAWGAAAAVEEAQMTWLTFQPDCFHLLLDPLIPCLSLTRTLQIPVAQSYRGSPSHTAEQKVGLTIVALRCAQSH